MTLYTHVLNRGSRGVQRPLITFAKLPLVKAAGFSGCNGRPKTGREIA